MNRRILCIGGSPCAGKSTVAERISKEYGAYYYKVDDHIDEFINLAAEKGYTTCKNCLVMTPEENWMRPPAMQRDEEFDIYDEMSEFVFDFLDKIDSDFIITEGAAYTPKIIKKYGIQEYITIIPTPEFQITHYKEREYVPYVLEGCSDKQKAFDNWMQRDILFAEYVRSECEKNDIPCIINDGLISKDEMFEKVKKKVNINQYNTQTKMKIMGQTDKQSVQQHPFPPLYDKDSKVLILGSFPSVKSREMKFFYGHPQNRFWKVIASIFDQENPTSIEEKKKLILDNNLALWDVIAECEILGSSDASIKNAKANDLSEIIKNSKIQKIIVNGKTAERLYIKYIEPVTGIKAVVLPSTSPANAAWSLERLVDVWKSEIKN